MKQRSATRAKPKVPESAAAPAASDASPDHVEPAFPIVGVGASAGGLDAYRTLFSTLPADCGAAFVLIQHLDPTRKSLTAELVGGYTMMPVVQAEEGMRVEIDHVYVIPPNTYLGIRDRTLRLSVPAESRSLRMAVDFFFESLAGTEHDRAVGIILSGSGTDGRQGLKAIKAAGGLTMVQDPKTAQHDGMPRSAMASADHVLPVEQMASTLLAHLRRNAGSEVTAETAPQTVSHALLEAIAVLQARTSFDFSGYKKGTLQRRLQHRMSLRRIAAIDDYTELLRTDPDEAAALFVDLLINVTGFFRDPEAWQLLQEKVVRPMVAAQPVDAPIRVWVPACASGEEAYSMAILFLEELEQAGKRCELQIFASDLDTDALETARAGIYPASVAESIGPRRTARYFLQTEHGVRVSKQLRDTVVFAQQSLVRDPPFSKLQLISCRNLLIYLEQPVQDRLIPLLHFALVDGGCLFLGSAEGIGAQTDLFEAISAKWRIYRRIGRARHERLEFPISGAHLPIVHGRVPGPPTPARLAALAQTLMQRYSPACVIINRIGEILYFHGPTDDYLTRPDGLPTRDLVGQVREGLRSKLRGAVRDAIHGKQKVVVSGVHVRRGDSFPRVRIVVEPLPSTTETESLWLVVMEDETEADGAGTAPAASGEDIAHVQQLEYELRATKEDLHQTIEELRASNEELMSSNEELQSTNEELETSKEELQSLNEELTTANSQLENKIGELEASNNDLDNLLSSTNIATLFLDTQLRIRRFTPAATRLFSLIPADIGRPLSDIVQRFSDPALLSDAALVLTESVTPRQEVQAEDGRWYVRQVLPYRTRDNRTEGVVITMSDVAAEAIEEARLYAEAIVDTVREPLLVLDGELRVVSANRSFYSTFKVSSADTAGRSLYELGGGEWDIPQLRTLLGEVLPKQHVMNDFEMKHDFLTTVGPRNLLLNARALLRGGDRPGLILLAIEDVTERMQLQSVLRESEDRTRNAEEARRRHSELAHSQRISTVGELASGLAHELNQPLAAIANEVEACVRYLRAGKADPIKLLSLLGEVSGEALRASQIVSHLRSFIEKGSPTFEVADLNDIARDVARLMRHEIDSAQVSLEIDAARRQLPINADRIQIEQIVVNLIQNAIDSLRSVPGDLRKIRLTTKAADGMAQLSVRDNGPRMTTADAERMFEPFFTTKPEGLGMGLAISRSIIEAHRGRVWAEAPGAGERGTTVCFALPLQRPGRKRSAG